MIRDWSGLNKNGIQHRLTTKGVDEPGRGAGNQYQKRIGRNSLISSIARNRGSRRALKSCRDLSIVSVTAIRSAVNRHRHGHR